MAKPIRVGALYTKSSSNPATAEQLAGARFAVDYTSRLWEPAGQPLELIEREVPADPDAAEAAARDLAVEHGCAALMEMSTIPVAVRLADWCEREGALFMTAHNNPVVRQGKRRTFGIGVPSELTGEAAAWFLVDQLKARRVFLVNEPVEFQIYAAHCVADALARRGVAVERGELRPEPADRTAFVAQGRAWGPDAVSIFSGGELESAVAFTKEATAAGGWAPTLFSRSSTCAEFVSLCRDAAEGDYFIDLLLRGERASVEEQALASALAQKDPAAIPTANHAFGWDGLRLVADAIRTAGSDRDAYVAYLEELKAYPGVTGNLTFGPDDHNGHFQENPTTISQLRGGRFIPYSSMNR